MDEEYLQGIAPLPAEEWLPTIFADRNKFKSLGCPHGLRFSSVESCPVYGGKNHAQTGRCRPLDACLLGCSRSPTPLAPGARLCEGGRTVIALTHVRVIDGTGAAPREDQTVVISKGKIESVSDAASANVPQDALVLDLHGYSVIPGLVGMHDHMFYPMGNGIFGEMAFSYPRLYLAGGVTTIRTTVDRAPHRS